MNEIPQCEIPKELELGVYSNEAFIFSRQEEMLIDFCFRLPPDNKLKLVSRVTVCPAMAKRIMMALAGNIKLYEQSFGEIKTNVPVQSEGMKQ